MTIHISLIQLNMKCSRVSSYYVFVKHGLFKTGTSVLTSVPYLELLVFRGSNASGTQKCASQFLADELPSGKDHTAKPSQMAWSRTVAT